MQPDLYNAHGIVLASQFPLAELDIAPVGEADIEIAAAAVPSQRRDERQFRIISFTPTEQYFDFAGVGRFVISDGRKVATDLAPQFDPRLASLPLLGPVMATLFHVRGYAVLHASALAIDRRAIVLLGDKGAGKSTTAAALIAGGWDLLADDVVPLMCQEGATDDVTLCGGYRSMKLDAATGARWLAGRGAPLDPDCARYTQGKIRFRLDGKTPDQAIPVAAIFTLRRGNRFAVEPLSATSAVDALLRFHYLPKLGPHAINQLGASRLLRQCVDLATRIRVASLTVPDGIEHLEELGDRLRGDLCVAS